MKTMSEEELQSENQENKVLSRKKRFAVLGYLTLMLILLNTALLIISNVVINNNNNNNNNNNGGGEKRSLENAMVINEVIENFTNSDFVENHYPKNEMILSRPRRSIDETKIVLSR